MPNRTRKICISVRLTEEEHRQLKEKCCLAGLPMETVIRKLITDLEVKPKPPEEYRKLVRTVGELGNNLNQIAHIANITGQTEAEQIQQAVEIMREISRLIRNF